MNSIHVQQCVGPYIIPLYKEDQQNASCTEYLASLTSFLLPDLQYRRLTGNKTSHIKCVQKELVTHVSYTVKLTLFPLLFNSGLPAQLK